MIKSILVNEQTGKIFKIGDKICFTYKNCIIVGELYKIKAKEFVIIKRGNTEKYCYNDVDNMDFIIGEDMTERIIIKENDKPNKNNIGFIQATKQFNPFKNDGEKYIWALLNTDGKTRCDLLNINEKFYYVRSYAEKWYKDILSKIEESDVDYVFKYRAIIRLKNYIII